MTLRYEAIKMYHRNVIIPVDSYSYQDYMAGKSDTLEIRVNGVWINIKPPCKDYRLYSHTYSPSGLKRVK